MVKKVLIGLIIGSLPTACGIKGASTIVIPTVHMRDTGFIQTSITLHKGEMLELVADNVILYS